MSTLQVKLLRLRLDFFSGSFVARSRHLADRVKKKYLKSILNKVMNEMYQRNTVSIVRMTVVK